MTDLTQSVEEIRIAGYVQYGGDKEKNLTTLGGRGSGNFGHAGRPGEVGGSEPGGGGNGGSAVNVPPGTTKSSLAKSSYKPSTAAKQQWAEANEQKLVAMIGGKQSGDNLPADVVVTMNGGLHGVEVKTMLDNSNDKITMHPPSLARKVAWGEKNNATLHTIVFDDRDKFGTKGYSGHSLYYRRGVGSFRIQSMIKVTSKAQLRRLMSAAQ